MPARKRTYRASLPRATCRTMSTGRRSRRQVQAAWPRSMPSVSWKGCQKPWNHPATPSNHPATPSNSPRRIDGARPFGRRCRACPFGGRCRARPFGRAMTLLILKLVLVPALVAGLTLAARRWGPFVGGLLLGLPVVAGPTLYFYAVEQGD